MIDYNNVKQTIAANLPDNNKQEITAEKLRSTLNEFVDKVETTETGIEGNVSEINTKITRLGKEGIYDVSANNDGATFASLSALLSDENLSTLIPDDVRGGGMSIRFVRSSDNKYMQYRLTNQNWSIDVNDWTGGESGPISGESEFATGEKVSKIGIDDKPTAGSNNLVKSGGVSDSISQIDNSKVNINTSNLIDQSKIQTNVLINSSGSEEVGSWGDSYKCTGFIEVNHSDIICDNSIFINAVWPSYAVYDKQKRFLRAIFENSVYSYQSGDEYVRMNLYSSSTQNQANYGSVLRPYTPYNPIGGYIDQLGLAKSNDVYTKQEAESKFVPVNSPLFDEKVNTSSINLIDKTQIKKGYILNSSGSESHIGGTSYGYTQNYIPVSQNFIWNYALADGGNNTIVVYDKNKNRIRGITLPSASVGQYIYQEGDAFIRVNFTTRIGDDVRGNYGDVLLDYTPYNPIAGYLTDTGAAISNLDSRVTNIENKAYSTPFLTGMFNNCICIGDSITAGWREDVGDLKNYSYPATLKKLTNWEITNAASGGQNASGWMANTVYGGASQHDFSQHDIAIIFLGQNPEEDDSYRTNMQAIIDLLKTANPLIRIFMLVRSVSTTGHWGIAQELANSNNIPLFNIYSQEAAIDLSNTLYHKMMSNSSGYDTVHFNTLGYNALGKVVFSFINDYIGSHQNEFKNVGDSIDL